MHPTSDFRGLGNLVSIHKVLGRLGVPIKCEIFDEFLIFFVEINTPVRRNKKLITDLVGFQNLLGLKNRKVLLRAIVEFFSRVTFFVGGVFMRDS